MCMGYALCRWLVRCLWYAPTSFRSEKSIAVHHGKYFTPPEKVERLDAPQLETQPSTPPQVIQPVHPNGASISGNAIERSLTSLLYRKMEETEKKTVPFYCYGFV